MKTKKTMIEQFASARAVSVPIVVLQSADQAATVQAIASRMPEAVPLLRWDAAEGLRPVCDLEDGKPNKAGAKLVADAKIDPEATIQFANAMSLLAGMPARTLVFAFNAHRQLLSQEPGAVAASVQAVANLTRLFKRNYRMLVLLGPEGFTAPPELAQEVYALHHELPDADVLAGVVRRIHKTAQASIPTIKDLTEAEVTAAVDALSGLSEFAAEQATATSYTEEGLQHDTLWSQKRVMVEQTPGLRVWTGTERFSDIVGQDALKAECRLRIGGRRSLGVVVWMDEIDKALANVEHDTSGVRMYQLLKLLQEMEDNEWPGFVAVGVQGSGKSLLAKALGNEAGVPTVALDLGASESKYVGESESNMLRIISTIKAMGRGNAYFVGTSNAMTVMRPELQRRFTDGMWMFDLMSDAEKAAAWKLFMKKYQLPAQPMPADALWTGAEIRNCCRRAYDVRCTLLEAARSVMPMAVSRASDIEALRQFANGKFLDANSGGFYQYRRQDELQRMHREELAMQRAMDLSPTELSKLALDLVTNPAKAN